MKALLVFFALSASAVAAEPALDFPCASEIQLELGSSALADHYPAIRAIALLAQAPELPNPEGLTHWKEVRGYVTDRTDLDAYPKLKVDCPDQRLYPTHPQQSTKLYHRYNSNQYANTKLKGSDLPCLIASAEVGAKRRFCLRADIGYDVIISDTYQDACGHYYRGFKQKTFLGKDENMGTLFSEGRTVFQKPYSPIQNDMTYGHTFSVEAKELLMVGPLFPGDDEAIARGRKDAEATNVYDEASRLYRQK